MYITISVLLSIYVQIYILKLLCKFSARNGSYDFALASGEKLFRLTGI